MPKLSNALTRLSVKLKKKPILIPTAALRCCLMTEMLASIQSRTSELVIFAGGQSVGGYLGLIMKVS